MLCPHCGASLLRLTIKDLTGSIPFDPNHRQFACVAYGCPSCQKAIGVQMDPLAIKTDIVNELFERLRRP